jgi:hypothetical protein
MKNNCLVILFCIFLVVSCQKNKNDNELNTKDNLWLFEEERSLEIKGQDTLKDRTTEDGRFIGLEKNDLLIIYWEYPYNKSNSIWYKKGLDSIYFYFDGATSDIIDKYKILSNNSTEMILEETSEASNEIVYRTIYKLVKQ